MSGPVDEFAWIASLRPLTGGDRRALDLADDAAVLPGRPGFDLVMSKDAMVEGVHFPTGETADVIARRLLRTSLSDLAAKAAEPFGYLLLTAWPHHRGEGDRQAFRAGLEADGLEFGVVLIGGDTVSTPGPMIVCATVLGWAEQGRAVLRSGARAGDALVVCGQIGDGWLGLQAVQGALADPDGVLAARYRFPAPLFAMRQVLAEQVNAAADVSDGLIADAAHVAEASGLGLSLELNDIPLSAEGRAWLAGHVTPEAALLILAVGGDDYAIVCAVDPSRLASMLSAARAANVPAARVGTFEPIPGTRITLAGRPVTPGTTGWRHS
ncbi:MAG TPA: thiamine-phosphate kinase [Caulobacteraceae bacterium]|jgi:thiamine-monophosphate kinase|nr:thiamine-phosphate kinase [Caulobacteraceae bacterium]